MNKIEKQFLKHILKIDDVQLLLLDEIPKEALEQLEIFLNRYNKGEPFAYIVNEVNFMGLDFFVDENVLIPRQETELLVEEILKYLDKSPKARILDICTGSGCILVSILKLSENCVGTGVDISDEALKIARKNATMHGIECELIKSDMLENISEKYDIVISNPPYIKTEDMLELEISVKEYEPHLALDGGKDGLHFYKIIRNNFENILLPNGVLFLEIGYNQGNDIVLLFEGFDVEIKKDYSGFDRIAIVKRIVL